MSITIGPASKFSGSPSIPGDKSISHRSLIFGALANGVTEISDLLESEDVQSTARCLKQLGIQIERSGTEKSRMTKVIGRGKSGFSTPSEDLDCGNSGTTIRLLMGLLAGLPVSTRLTGDPSLSKRPMKRVANPLRTMGAQILLTNEGFCPLEIKGAPLKGVTFDLTVASAQIKSAVLLAGLLAEGKTTITGKIQSRDHSERMLRLFGIDLKTSDSAIEIEGGQTLQSTSIQVPGDPSTAAFSMAAASLIPNSDLILKNISLNPTRLGFLNVLKRMGGDVETEVTTDNSEPIGTIRVKFRKLQGVVISPEEIPSLIDELPLIAVIATQATGTTIVTGAEELRVKESDRLEAIALNLRAMGAEIELFEDGFKIHGNQKLRGAKIETFLDHRIAMAFSIAGLVAEGETEILQPEAVAVSYPRFFQDLEELTR